MCGINLIINKTSHNIDISHIKRMNNEIYHRGPDFQEYLEIDDDYQLFIGHTRLQILDCTTDSNQPFFSLDNRYFLIFNGEKIFIFFIDKNFI